MFYASTSAAAPPRASYPDVPRIVETVDLRTRQIADIMVRLNAEHPEGCTETTLLLEGVSPHEQRHYGPAARQLANGTFQRQDAVLESNPPSDDMLVAEGLKVFDGLAPAFAIKLRGLGFDDDVLARLWPRLATGGASRLARSPLPARL